MASATYVHDATTQPEVHTQTSLHALEHFLHWPLLFPEGERGLGYCPERAAQEK